MFAEITLGQLVFVVLIAVSCLFVFWITITESRSQKERIQKRNQEIQGERAEREKKIPAIKESINGQSLVVLARLPDGKFSSFETDVTDKLIEFGAHVWHLSKKEVSELWSDPVSSVRAGLPDTVVLVTVLNKEGESIGMDVRVLNGSCVRVLKARRCIYKRFEAQTSWDVKYAIDDIHERQLFDLLELISSVKAEKPEQTTV